MTTSKTHIIRYVALFSAICLSLFASCKKAPLPVAVTSISLDASYIELEIGKSYWLTAVISPHDSDNQKVIWSSGNAAVAIVNDGKITALKAGLATITAKSDDGGHTAECEVKVIDPQSSDEEENEEAEKPDSPAEQSKAVKYTVKIPNEANVNELIYEVYKTAEPYAESLGENDVLLCHESVSISGNIATIQFEVYESQNYTVLFWAHVADNGIYDVTSLTDVTIPTTLPSNTSDTDAFAGRGHIVADSYQTEYEVQLRRPISKLKVGCKSEFEEHTEIFKSCSQTISIDGLYTTYDVGQLRAKGSLSTIHLTESLTLGKEENGYIIISDNYLGFAGDGTDATAVVLNLMGFREFGTENIIPIGIGLSTYMSITLTSNRYRVGISLYELGDSGTK